MRTLLPDLAHSIPVNKTALRVILPGIDYEIEIPKSHKIYDNQPSIRSISKSMYNDPNFIDYTNIKFGRLVVIGVSEDTPKSSRYHAKAIDEHDFIMSKKIVKRTNCKWIVRCACGKYEIRPSKIIRKKPEFDRCFICNKILSARKSDFFRKNNRSPFKHEMNGW